MDSMQYQCSQCRIANVNVVLDDSQIEAHISAQHLDYFPLECAWCKEENQKHFSASKEDMKRHTWKNHNGRNSKYLVVEDGTKEVNLKNLAKECRRHSAKVAIPQIPSNDAKSALRRVWNVLAGVSSSANAAENELDITHVKQDNNESVIVIENDNEMANNSTEGNILEELLEGYHVIKDQIKNTKPRAAFEECRPVSTLQRASGDTTNASHSEVALYSALNRAADVDKNVQVTPDSKEFLRRAFILVGGTSNNAENISTEMKQKNTEKAECLIQLLSSAESTAIVETEQSAVDPKTNSANIPNVVVLTKQKYPENAPVGLQLPATLSSFISIDEDSKPNIASSTELELIHSGEDQEMQDQRNSCAYKNIRKPSICHKKRNNLDNPLSNSDLIPKKRKMLSGDNQSAVPDVSAHFDQCSFKTDQYCAHNQIEKEIDESQVFKYDNAQPITETSEAEEGEIESDTDFNIEKPCVPIQSIAQLPTNAGGKSDISGKERRKLKQKLRTALRKKEAKAAKEEPKITPRDQLKFNEWKASKNQNSKLNPQRYYSSERDNQQLIPAENRTAVFEDKQSVGPAADSSTHPGHCSSVTNQGIPIAAQADDENCKEEMNWTVTREKLLIKEGHNILQWTRNYDDILRYVQECEEALQNNSSLPGQTVEETREQIEKWTRAAQRTKNKLDAEKLKWDQQYASKYGAPPTEYTKPVRLQHPKALAIDVLDV